MAEWRRTSSPTLCQIEGECRSHDEARLAEVSAAMVDAVQRAAAETGVDVDVDLVHEFRAFALTGSLAGRSPGQGRDRSVSASSPRCMTAGGGSDANVLNARGLPTINLSIG